ncbi:hypothetical protein BDQ17DRAFT_1429090 [Cyathus striatus]|nr:hypothetical protein BDQ17DRAFT_1429090 [Cyathus striatus]
MFSEHQNKAIASAKALLLSVGLNPNLDNVTPLDDLESTPSDSFATLPLLSDYTPSTTHAEPIEPHIVATNVFIHKQLTIDYLIDHPLGEIVEYPEAASSLQGIIGHRFTVNPSDYYNTKFNIQYSLGAPRGAINNVHCGMLLLDDENHSVLCVNLKETCKGLKVCEEYSKELHNSGPREPSAEEIVFNKTLSFYCAMQETGCSFDSIDINEYCGDYDSDDDFNESDEDPSTVQKLSPSGSLCSGRMVFSYDRYNHPRLQCEFRTRSDKAHLILRNLQEFNLDYLKALVGRDISCMLSHETRAWLNGYGPLMACTFQASPSEKKTKCPYWHRDSSGKLRRGTLKKLQNKCLVKYSIYTPNDLFLCPQIVIISYGVHSHPPPLPVNTPPPIRALFSSMLQKLGWKLADATPRKIMMESAFISSLRKHINWPKDSVVDPPLSALHASLGNLDHVHRLIDTLRRDHYPGGTGFSGVQHLVNEHMNLPDSKQYVCCAESHIIEKGKIFYLILCMLKAMAFSLMQASLSSTTERNLDPIFDIINTGGPKAEAWLKDKKKAKFVIPAIYQPASLIPLEIWQASASSTNGNEQAHRNINHDGINLTLLGGIMRGMQYDFYVHSSINLHSSQGIYMRDQLATEFHRSNTSVSRQVRTQRRVAHQSPRKSPQKKSVTQANYKYTNTTPLPQHVFDSSTLVHRRVVERNHPAPYPSPYRQGIVFGSSGSNQNPFYIQ